MTYKEHLATAEDEMSLSRDMADGALRTVGTISETFATLSLAAATRANYHVQMARLLSAVRVDVLR